MSNYRKCVVCGAAANGECLNCGSLPTVVSRQRIAALEAENERLRKALDEEEEEQRLEDLVHSLLIQHATMYLTTDDAVRRIMQAVRQGRPNETTGA
jgi:hypothetical protein